MAVYGKRGRALVRPRLTSSPPGSPEREPIDIAITDSNSTLLIDENAIKNNRYNDSAVVSSDNSELTCNENTRILAFKRDRATDFSAFDFLERDSAPKSQNKRPRHTRTVLETESFENLHEPADREFVQTYDYVTDFVGSFKAKLDDRHEQVIEKMFEHLHSKDAKNRREVPTRRQYGRDRTIIINEDESDGDSAEEAIEDTSNTPHDIFELQNIGNTLKYQDDLDFMTGTENFTEPQYLSKLLSLALMLQTDKEFRYYVIKYRNDEVWDWCMSRTLKELNHGLCNLLRGYIAIELSVPKSTKMSNIASLIIELSYRNNLPCHNTLQKLPSKITQLNYQDFLQNLNFRSCSQLSLELWNKYVVKLYTDNDTITRILNLNGSDLAFHDRKLWYKLILDILTALPVKANDFDMVLLLDEFLRDNLNDECFVKCLILLFNHENHLQGLTVKENQDLVHEILHKIILTLNTTQVVLQEANLELVLLLLGLFLNITAQKFFSSAIHSIPNDIIAQLEEISLNLKSSNIMLKGLFYINFIFVKVEHGSSGDLKNLDHIKEVLTTFKSDLQNFKSDIGSKIDFAMNLIMS